MALQQGINSYVSNEQADDYFLNRVHNGVWDDNIDIQEEALVTASGILDLEKWVGMTTSPDQPLAWPRVGVVVNTRSGWDIDLDKIVGGVPQAVIRATCELALHLINNEDLLEDTGTTESLKVSSITLVSTTKAEKIPTYIRSIYRELLVSGGDRRVF